MDTLHIGRFRVVLDACVLHPATLRGLFMELCLQGLYKAHWSQEISDEWKRSVLARHPDVSEQKLLRLQTLMNAHVEDALVTNYEHLIPTLHLPDPDDRHVLAAAIHVKADAIVTSNLRDFPEEILDPWEIEVIDPDEFFINQYDISITRVLSAVKASRDRLKNPPYTPEQFIEKLRRAGVPRFAERLMSSITLI